MHPRNDPTTDFRALLLTDVVDSTRLCQAIGDRAMAEVWAAHDRAARDLLPQWRGREIDKTDGMLLLFDAAADALGYALAYHRALAVMPVPLQARAGLHAGPVIVRENIAHDVARGAKPLEIDGLAKPLAARVMALAGAGQTLLTAAARDALAAAAPPLQSHGHWMVKGVTEPIELFEVGAPDRPMRAPADSDKAYRVVRAGERWLPVTEIANNLPQPASSFVGREREIDEVAQRLGATRLLTLLGTGGLGKTRLALQVAAERKHLFPDGVWFVDLAPLRDGTLVAAEAAQVLGVAEEPGRPLAASIAVHLRARRALLILDNCEHLIEPAAALAHTIAAAAPKVRVLATSREPLRVQGEHTLPILPLPLPQPGAGLAALRAVPAVQLFVQRAQAHEPAFELDEREAPAVAELVARLEGIPLALELAASRVRALSVAEINRRLNDRYQLLTGGSRVLQQRQQTLRALVDWSYELLDAKEQRLLQRLAVFACGCDLEAAEAVCGAEPIATGEVPNLLSSLVDKSLVMRQQHEGGSRYRMLETIRDYAREKLQHDGEEAAAALRHHEHYVRLAKEARSGLDGADLALWLTRLELELDNLRAAMALALAGGADPVNAVKLATALQGFWILRGYSTEGRRLVKAALELPAVQAFDLAKAHALYVGAALAQCQSDPAEARCMLQEALTIHRTLGDPANIAATLSTLATARLEAGDAAGARADQAEALTIFRELGHGLNQAIGLCNLGQVALFEGDLDAARRSLAEALELVLGIDSPEQLAECELLLGEVALEAGEPLEANTRFQRSLSICLGSADKRGAANASWRLGAMSLAGGDRAAARSQLHEALAEFRAAEMWKELLGCLEDLAVLAMLSAMTAQAVRIAAAASVAWQRLGLARRPAVTSRFRAQLGAMRADLGDARFDAAWSEAAQGWGTEDAIQAALALPSQP